MRSTGKAQCSRLYALLCLADSGQRPCPTVPKAITVLLLPCFASSRATLHTLHLQPPCYPVLLGLGVTDLLLSHVLRSSGQCTLSSLKRLGSWQVSELPARAGRSPPPPSRCVLPDSREPRSGSSAGKGSGVSGQPGKAAASNRVSAGQSVSERYWQMRATESQRVALGEDLARPAHLADILIIAGVHTGSEST